MKIVEAAPEAPGALYAAAFPDEDLAPLVRAILADGAALSLTAVLDGAEVGHALFSPCSVDDGPRGEVWLLGPVAVVPERQRAGVGSALIRHGLDRLAAGGARLVMALGDPAYYARFGFAPDAGIAPPYALPEEWAEAWRSLALRAGPPLKGTLVPIAPWRRRAYWSP